jgi:hypothetical protein
MPNGMIWYDMICVFCHGMVFYLLILLFVTQKVVDALSSVLVLRFAPVNWNEWDSTIHKIQTRRREMFASIPNPETKVCFS